MMANLSCGSPIAGLVDVLSALISDRPNRSAWLLDRALDYLPDTVEYRSTLRAFKHSSRLHRMCIGSCKRQACRRFKRVAKDESKNALFGSRLRPCAFAPCRIQSPQQSGLARNTHRRALPRQLGSCFNQSMHLGIVII